MKTPLTEYTAEDRRDVLSERILSANLALEADARRRKGRNRGASPRQQTEAAHPKPAPRNLWPIPGFIAAGISAGMLFLGEPLHSIYLSGFMFLFLVFAINHDLKHHG